MCIQEHSELREGEKEGQTRVEEGDKEMVEGADVVTATSTQSIDESEGTLGGLVVTDRLRQSLTQLQLLCMKQNQRTVETCILVYS